LSKDKAIAFGSFEYLLPAAMLILMALLVLIGSYLLQVESSPSVYDYFGGVAFVIVGFLIKFSIDLVQVRRQKKREKMGLIEDLLNECQENLGLIESKKIKWPQIHFKVASYTLAREKAALSHLSSALQEQIGETYKHISEIERRKIRTFDETTDMMLETLFQALLGVIDELKPKA